MQVVPSTLLALFLAVVLFSRGPYRGLWVFLAASPFGAAAAFNLPAVGGATIGIMEFAAMVLFAYILLQPHALNRLFGSLRPGQPGFWLAYLIVFCAISALFFPRIFAGDTLVFSVARADNVNGIIGVPLRPTNGNITQLFRISLEVVTFLALATVFRYRPDPAPVVAAMAVAAGLNVALGWLDVATFAAGIEALMEPLRTSNYAILVNHRMVGLKRMIGGFPEASSFGSYSLGMFGFWLGYFIRGARSRLALWMLVLTGIVLLRSTSSSAYVALVLFLALLIVLAVLGNLRPRMNRRGVAIVAVGIIAVWASFVGVFGSYHMVDSVTAFLDRALFDKFETASGVERMSWNAQAIQNLIDTRFIGAGLGSVRASSWLAACLGSIGLLGTILYVLFLVSVANSPTRTGDAERDAVIRGLRYGCLALMIQALLTKATPSLGIFFFAMAGLIVGLSRGGALLAAARPRPKTENRADADLPSP